jgi:Zn-dependent peptidase ImmA (M78 family)
MVSKETKMIKDYLKEIGFGNVRVVKGKETECDMLNNVIRFDKNWYDKKNKNLQAHDKIFKEYYTKKLNHKIKISMATYGLFHELGHLVSLKDYEGKSFNKAYARYIVGVKNIKTKSLKKSIYQYRNLKMERLADKYAYAIYLLNENTAIKFDKEMRKQFAC